MNIKKNLYRHFVLHVSSLFEFGIIDPGQVLDAISQMQEFILAQNHWSEKIEKNPVAKLEKDRKAPRKIIPVKESNSKTYIATGKSLSEALIFARGEYSVLVPAGPYRLSFFKMLLRENLPFMAEFFNSQQKLCQGTND